jgi:hypothetical protein
MVSLVSVEGAAENPRCSAARMNLVGERSLRALCCNVFRVIIEPIAEFVGLSLGVDEFRASAECPGTSPVSVPFLVTHALQQSVCVGSPWHIEMVGRGAEPCELRAVLCRN